MPDAWQGLEIVEISGIAAVSFAAMILASAPNFVRVMLAR